MPITHRLAIYFSKEALSKEALSLILNSERITNKFGNYGIDVLQSDRRIRVSSLYSTHLGKKITRTFAVVHYPAVVNVLFFEEHQKIVHGQSLGVVFKRNRWQMEKRPVYFGHLEASEDFASIYMLMGDLPPTRLAIHIYTLMIEKQAAKFRYGTVTEIHHPTHLNLDALKEAYEHGSAWRQSEHVHKILEVVRKKINQI